MLAMQVFMPILEKHSIAGFQDSKQATLLSFKDDIEDWDLRRPWRVLLLNDAITATRTHEPLLMKKTLQFLIHNLPDDLRQFFTEGMSQMTALNYPEEVQELMEKYYWQYAMQEIKKH